MVAQGRKVDAVATKQQLGEMVMQLGGRHFRAAILALRAKWSLVARDSVCCRKNRRGAAIDDAS